MTLAAEALYLFYRHPYVLYATGTSTMYYCDHPVITAGMA